MTRRVLIPLLLAACIPATPLAQVTYDRLLKAAGEPHNWLTYSGTYASHRHSFLRDVSVTTAKDLELKWVFQADSLRSFEATPLVVDGVMYFTQAPNDVVALDAKTGRAFWIYRYTPIPMVGRGEPAVEGVGRLCCRGQVNRGLAILGETLLMATADAHLVAIDAKAGRPVWKTKVADANLSYSMTLAPLVIKDKVLVGVSGGEFGIRGFIAAYHVATGREAWRFHTVPAPGEPGHETWSGDSWQHGAAAVWLTGSYDPHLNLTYWGTGNPGPDYNPSQRKGDNLYSNSVVALDADTGKLKWHFQFTPNDARDYDATQIPVLVDRMWNGTPRKLMLWANRNGFYYVLDRTDGKFLLGRPFISKLNWARGLDENGRPIPADLPPGTPTYPGVTGATNWYSPSYSPSTGLFYIPAWENLAGLFGESDPVTWKPGQYFVGGARSGSVPGTVPMPGFSRDHINTWHEGNAHGVIMALDPATGDKKWTFEMHDVTSSGILTTASDVLLVGGREGYFLAINARNGELLWKASLGGEIIAGPITYQADGKQYVSIAAGHSLFAFGLR